MKGATTGREGHHRAAERRSDVLRDFFEANMIVVVFGYGLVFFLMGFAITLQSRMGSRLTLARSLPLLGTFGILHGIAEWGQVFIPVQSLYLHEGVIAVLQALATALLALAFVSLFSFGARLLTDTTGKFRWLTWLPMTLFSLWLVAFLIVGIGTGQGDYRWWLAAGDLWSRYLLAFTGALLSCYALMLQAKEFRDQDMAQLLPHLRVGVFSFLLYAVAGGLLVPPSEFVPANLLNSDRFFQWTGLPIQIPRAIAGLFMAYSIVRILEIFDIESARRLEQAERTRAILEERDRIARELHDGIIQSLYAVGLNLEIVQYMMEERPEEAKRQTALCMKNLNKAIQDIRSYIMDLKVSPDSRLSLVKRLQALVEDLGTSFHRSVELVSTLREPPSLSEEAMNHVCQIVRESVTNAVKHGEAQHIQVRLEEDRGRLSLQVIDDGKGFTPDAPRPEAGSGNGLNNMKYRARQLSGELAIRSSPRGTTVQLWIPWPGRGSPGSVVAPPAARGLSKLWASHGRHERSLS